MSSRYEGQDRRSHVGESWHLDKKVPIALIFSFLAQTCAFVWWASGMDSKVNDHERRIIASEAFAQRVDGSQQQVGERLARLEEQSKSGNATLERIELTLRELAARTDKR